MITDNTQLAKSILEMDGVIGFPTETVYGLAGNAFSEKAIFSIFDLKKRPLNNPFIVHIGSIHQLEGIVREIPPKAIKLINQFWPGPLTLLLKKSAKISDLVTAGQDTVAVRIPNHTLALDLLNSIDFPLVAPSANPYQSISPTAPEHVESYFGNEIPLILDGGPCNKGLESTIVGFEGDQVIVYRLGALTLEDLESCVGTIEEKTNNHQQVKSPGMAKKHYSPKTPLLFSSFIRIDVQKYVSKKIAVVCFDDLYDLESNEWLKSYSFHGDLQNASANLYGLLHDLDSQNYDLIIIEKFPDLGLGKTLNDRLERASFKH
jgi:L-threonylcarbamoyladenylate synthase